MYIFITFLICVLIFFILTTIKREILIRKIRKFNELLFDLKTGYLIYDIRKMAMEKYNLKYDTSFSCEYNDGTMSFRSSLSQKQFIAILYDQIAELDNLIKEIPEDVIKSKTELFYDLRFKIRSEKLANENTTY